MAVMRPDVIKKTDLQFVHLAAGYAREHAWAANFLPRPEQAKHLNSNGRWKRCIWKMMGWLPISLYT
jgi:hypothetical protein